MPSVQKGGTEISGELGGGEGGGGGCTHTSAARCVVLDEPDAARLLLTLQPLPPTGDAVEGKLRSSWKRFPKHIIPPPPAPLHQRPGDVEHSAHFPILFTESTQRGRLGADAACLTMADRSNQTG